MRKGKTVYSSGFSQLLRPPNFAAGQDILLAVPPAMGISGISFWKRAQRCAGRGIGELRRQGQQARQHRAQSGDIRGGIDDAALIGLDRLGRGDDQLARRVALEAGVEIAGPWRRPRAEAAP